MIPLKVGRAPRNRRPSTPAEACALHAHFDRSRDGLVDAGEFLSEFFRIGRAQQQRALEAKREETYQLQAKRPSSLTLVASLMEQNGGRRTSSARPHNMQYDSRPCALHVCEWFADWRRSSHDSLVTEWPAHARLSGLPMHDPVACLWRGPGYAAPSGLQMQGVNGLCRIQLPIYV